MNVAIIVAAGSGTRFGSKTPKQFLEIGGQPLLIYTIEKFDKCASVSEIILVLAADEFESFNLNLKKYNFAKNIKTVTGGTTRAESVRCGLNAIDADKCEIVAVHDGARPLVSINEISETIEKARHFGAVCLVAEVTDTIKKVSGDRIIGTVNRENLKRALTPQTFRFEILQKAFAPENFDPTATDECFLVEKLGCKIAFIMGGARNIKITKPEDLLLLENFLRVSDDDAQNMEAILKV